MATEKMIGEYSVSVWGLDDKEEGSICIDIFGPKGNKSTWIKKSSIDLIQLDNIAKKMIKRIEGKKYAPKWLTDKLSIIEKNPNFKGWVITVRGSTSHFKNDLNGLMDWIEEDRLHKIQVAPLLSKHLYQIQENYGEGEDFGDDAWVYKLDLKDFF